MDHHLLAGRGHQRLVLAHLLHLGEDELLLLHDPAQGDLFGPQGLLLGCHRGLGVGQALKRRAVFAADRAHVGGLLDGVRHRRRAEHLDQRIGACLAVQPSDPFPHELALRLQLSLGIGQAVLGVAHGRLLPGHCLAGRLDRVERGLQLPVGLLQGDLVGIGLLAGILKLRPDGLELLAGLGDPGLLRVGARRRQRRGGNHKAEHDDQQHTADAVRWDSGQSGGG